MTSRLSSLLVRDGVIGVKRMEKAFQRQVLYGGGLDTILLEMGEITEQRLLQYLSLATGLPPANAGELEPSDERAIVDVAREVVANGLSVRDVEARARQTRPEPRRPIVKTQNRSYSEIQRLEEQLRRHLQTDISITVSRDYRGSIAISFYSADDLDRIRDLVLGPNRDTT